MKINFYNEQQDYFTTRSLKTGAVIVLVSGVPDIEMLEDTDMIEAKQGPYSGVEDKERFEPAGRGACGHCFMTEVQIVSSELPSRLQPEVLNETTLICCNCWRVRDEQHRF